MVVDFAITWKVALKIRTMRHRQGEASPTAKWFSTKYYASVMNIKEFYEENLGLQFLGIISNALNKKNFAKITNII
jgi:hypothetical protein